MSVCKDCSNEIYDGYYAAEKDRHKAVLNTCRILNIIYLNEAVDAALKDKEKRDAKKSVKHDVPFFSIYKGRLANMLTLKKDVRGLTFVEPTSLTSDNPITESDEGYADLTGFWGEGMSWEDYRYLETQYSEWSKSHSIDSQSEKVLLKFICLKELEIRKAMVSGSDTASLVKQFTELLKASALTPALSNVASGGKSMDSWGNFLAVIEQQTPAEYYEDKKLFADFDGIEKYIKKFILRPIRNFILNARDYNVSDDEIGNDEEYGILEEDLNADKPASIPE
jgi:hypothetical protein